jgi:hypothetical protein
VNLGQFRTAINRKTGIAFDTTALTEVVNEAVAAAGAEKDWEWLDAVATFATDGSATYTLPADWARTRTVTVGSEQTRRLNIADGDSWSVLDEVGIYSYAIEGGNLVIYPTSSDGQTVTHRYVKFEPTLTDDADEPLIPARFHQAIVCYGAAVVCDRGNDKRSDVFRAEYERWLKRMKDEKQRSQQPTRKRVRPGAGW